MIPIPPQSSITAPGVLPDRVILREPDWVLVEARASLPRLHFGATAIVDRSREDIAKRIRAGLLVVLEPARA
jgi:hypothetical protein